MTKPPVWRRLEVPADLDLGRLHEVIQVAMGWQDCHLHVFSDGGAEYGQPDPELGHTDERAVCLSQLLAGVGDRLLYTYDFGDGWEHDITLEKILPADGATAGAICTAGKGACPPGDYGGLWGYQELKATLADPNADEHESMLDWLGLTSPQRLRPAWLLRRRRQSPARPLHPAPPAQRALTPVDPRTGRGVSGVASMR